MKRFPPALPGIAHMIHGGDYNPDQWMKDKDRIWKEDMRLAREAHMNSMTVGIFSWTALEPEEGVYTFEWLDEVMDILAQNHMAAILATPSGAKPRWMAQKYPEILRVSEDRVRELYGGRENHCLTSPVYLAKVQEINGRLAQRYAGHPALKMWHISNEYSGECHCPLCQAAFRDYIRAKYGTLQALNEAYWSGFWSHGYTDFDQVESPSSRGDGVLHALKLDWMRFTTQQYCDYVRLEAEPLRRYTPDVPITHNLMSTYPGINYFELARELDVVSWDNYPLWRDDEGDDWVAADTAFRHDLHRGLGGGRPFLLMESSPSATNWQPVAKLRRPGVHRLTSLQAVAHGSDSVQYFQFRKGRGGYEKFHGAVVDHFATDKTRVFQEVAETGRLLEKLDHVTGTGVPSRVALVYDWENRWALDEMQGVMKEKNYERTVVEHYRAFFHQGINVDIIDSTCPLEGYSLVVAPMLYMIRGDFGAHLAEYVQKGGALAATYMTGWVEEHDLCFQNGFPGPLREVMGIWAEEMDAYYPGQGNTVAYRGKRYAVREMAERIHAEGAQVLGVYEEDFYAGEPAVTVNPYGQGKAYFIAARTGQDFLDDFYQDLAEELRIPRAAERLPLGCEATVREAGGMTYRFYLNHFGRPASVDVGEGGWDLVSGQRLAGEVKLPGRGVMILELRP